MHHVVYQMVSINVSSMFTCSVRLFKLYFSECSINVLSFLIIFMFLPSLARAAKTLEHKTGFEVWPRCLSEIDCQGGSPVPAGAYCDLSVHRCFCRLFQQAINGTCRPVQCKSSVDCRVGIQGQQYDADWWFTCTGKGNCKCQWPKELIDKGTACAGKLPPLNFLSLLM